MGRWTMTALKTANHRGGHRERANLPSTTRNSCKVQEDEYNYSNYFEESNDSDDDCSEEMTRACRTKHIFLTNVGSKSYHTLRALLQPNKPTEQMYDVCKETLQSHYSPKPTEIVQRYKFYTSVQKPNETIPVCREFKTVKWRLQLQRTG